MPKIHRRGSQIVLENEGNSLSLTETEARSFLHELKEQCELAEFFLPDEPLQIADFEFPSAEAERLQCELEAVLNGAEAVEVDWMRWGY